MKKLYSIAIIMVLATAVISGCSKGYESRKSVDDLTITLSAPSYPLIKGNNTVTVKLADAAGKAVNDAQISMKFYMPPMPGMAPMESTFQGVQKGDGYEFTVNPPMEGGWKADVTVARPGKPAASTTFNLDAR